MNSKYLGDKQIDKKAELALAGWAKRRKSSESQSENFRLRQIDRRGSNQKPRFAAQFSESSRLRLNVTKKEQGMNSARSQIIMKLEYLFPSKNTRKGAMKSFTDQIPNSQLKRKETLTTPRDQKVKIVLSSFQRTR